LPAAGKQPTRVTDSIGGGGQASYRAYWYSDGVAETRVSFDLDQTGKQAPHPTSINVDQGNQVTTLWATRGDGIIDWQQVDEGERRDGAFQKGSWFENIIDERQSGKADVLVQGYLGLGGNRFEQE
jgi:hypothetical protein